QWLRERHIDAVHVCGLATDYCVRATALDACAEGLHTGLLLDLVAGVAPQSTAGALRDFETAGIRIL
ncbi:MAG: isochorismatase family protein, partial [Allobranchiibius sp.]